MLTPLFRSLCIAAFALSAVVAWADPPGRVGRITYAEGDVSFYNDPDDDWQKAQINYPVTSENSLWIEGRGRAEVRFGPSAIRVGDDSMFDFVKLQDDIVLGFLQRGSVNVRLRQLGNFDPADTLQIDTSEGRFTLEGNGRYRLDTSRGESRISVISGTARFEDAGDTRLTINAGKQLTVRFADGTNRGADFRYDNVGETPLDRWADARDQQWDRAHTRYARTDTRDSAGDTLISPYMTGYEELDASGEWIDDNEYGRLWTPRVVVAGWAPYRYGRWSYVRPWGWTWIDDASWGFAPFHYGRWVQVHSRWCWWPGPYIGRPVYAPALVAWFGSAGSGLTISSGPAVGWFPLAPREYYVPRYSTNAAYLRRINYVTNNNAVINPPSRYRNQVPGATVVANNVFISGRPIGSQLTHLPPRTVAGHAPVASFDVPRPNRRSAGQAPMQMPDRRQDGRPVVPTPRPHFANDTQNPRNHGHLPALAGQQTPKFREPGSASGGPLPVQQATPQSAQGSNPVQGSNYPQPAPAANAPATPPANSPRSRPNSQPNQTPPHAGDAPGTARMPVESAPVMPDRDVRPSPRQAAPQQPALPQAAPASAPQLAPERPEARDRHSGSRGRPQSDAPPAPATAPAPQVVMPRAPSLQPQPASPQSAPQAVPVQPKVKPDAHAPKQQPDAQDENRSEARGKGKPDR